VARLLVAYHTDSDLQQTVRGFKDAGQTDRLERVAHRVLKLLDSPELNRILSRQALVLESFESLLADLPGDHAEQLQEVLGRNPLACPLVNVPVRELLNGYTDTSPLGRKVKGWMQTPHQRHRAQLCVTSLCQHLKESKEIPKLRSKQGTLIGLRQLIRQVGPKIANPLKETLNALQFDLT
jgi:hypothetical protein